MSVQGYQIYFIQKHHETLAIKFELNPCQFPPTEEKSSTDLDDVKTLAKKSTELNLVSDTKSEDQILKNDRGIPSMFTP